MQPVLDGEGEDEHERAEPDAEREQHGQAARHRGQAKQRRRQQRDLAPLSRCAARRRRGERRGRPRARASARSTTASPASVLRSAGPAKRRASRRTAPCRAGRRRPGAASGCRARCGPRPQHDKADRHVDQEDRPPASAGDIGADQEAAHDLADDGGDAGGRAVQGQGACLAFSVQRVMEGGEHLRDEQRGGAALHEPGDDQHPDRSAPDRRPARPPRSRQVPRGTGGGGRSGRRAGRPAPAARRTPRRSRRSPAPGRAREACRVASMLGRATLVMKKSMIGKKAPARRMNTPTGCSRPARARARGEAGRAVGSGSDWETAETITTLLDQATMWTSLYIHNYVP